MDHVHKLALRADGREPRPHKAAFLDRDGVINADHGYVHTRDQFDLLPGVLVACRALVDAGYALVIVTNQAGLARGYYTYQQFEALSTWMAGIFDDARAPLAAIYYCPHHPAGTIPDLSRACCCRKPAPGMFMQALDDLGIEASSSVVIGDKDSDLEAGRRAGIARGFLVDSSGAPGTWPSLREAVASLLAAPGLG